MEYPKINSLWKREGWHFDPEKKNDPAFHKGRHSFIIGDYALPEFAAIYAWRVEEKIDGTNIRVFFERDADSTTVRFGGRTKDAHIPCHLLDELQKIFTKEKLAEIFTQSSQVILFGEGYGPKIQAVGANYRATPGFILFDVWIDRVWLNRESVSQIAVQLGIPKAPDLGIMTTSSIVDFVKRKPLSYCSIKDHVMEGVVCRSEPLMLTRFGHPIMWKLKCKEFSEVAE